MKDVYKKTTIRWVKNRANTWPMTGWVMMIMYNKLPTRIYYYNIEVYICLNSITKWEKHQHTRVMSYIL